MKYSEVRIFCLKFKFSEHAGLNRLYFSEGSLYKYLVMFWGIFLTSKAAMIVLIIPTVIMERSDFLYEFVNPTVLDYFLQITYP